MLRFTTSERNQQVLNYLDFQYTVKRINKACVEWRCRNRSCSSSLTLSLDNTCVRHEPSIHSEYCQAVQPSKIIVEETVEIMKRRAREETKSISEIYAEEIVATRRRHPGVPTGYYFPTLSSIDSSLYYHRSLNYPTLPKCLNDMVLSGEWCLTRSGERFLLVDETYDNKERILLFGSRWSIKFLSFCSGWHADGTFLTRPLLFAQIYIIFGYFDGFLIPCIYCLTSRQDQVTYEKILNHIISIGYSQLNTRFSPQSLTCDFELGSINAAAKCFRNISITACFFHYSQALWRKVQDLKLNSLISKSKTNNNSWSEEQRKAAYIWFYGAIGLALIPPSHVESVWTNIMDEYTPETPLAQDSNDYMVENYVCQQSSRYSIELWNVFTNIQQKLPRNNNAAECYNHRMSTVFPPHPHIYEFIRRLKDEHEYQHHKAEEAQVHKKKRRNIYEKIDAKLLQLIHQFENGRITATELAIESGKTVKIKKKK
ncbi:unnamed protein product [Rotaria socialis]|uniref:MULE transposase domain-containing protein n=1 Tax=Rotaria socialis TaxID=392032 RepID=A0A818FD73_9BILA|nr:unnamed protein product [Rotaria socialis]CAF3474266.1 unnamed protein product [Rotaria socialis]CAF3483653.1 unnamed protein product [Rotaria socialis]CAF3632702.1 unnamed protein product [Rotaria socialis]CAF4534933.1 unnamed protein product [Rotaria socialis]